MKSIKYAIFAYCIMATASTSTLCTTPTITLFSHGIADTWKQARRYTKSYTRKNGIVVKNDRYLINTPYVSFNYPDATTKFYRVNYNETSFGQKNEIDRLYKGYQHITTKSKNCNVILKGVSRGASNLLIFAGLYQLENVRAMVLESPYHIMAEVIESKMQQMNLTWLPLSYGEFVAESIFKKYTRYGHSPANCIENIAKELPILIICSKEDSLVPYTSSLNVYKKLVETGHTHVYIFIAEHGRHAFILQGPDGEKYQQVVNAFYKKYNLPYSAEDAEKGESLLALCQPIFIS